MNAQQCRESLERARLNGRGASVFSPDEAAAFLGVSRDLILSEMRLWTSSRHREGIAWFPCGKGRLIRRESLDAYARQLEVRV